MTNDEIMEHIVALENTITPRRIREANLNLDSGWLWQVNYEIQQLREQLTDNYQAKAALTAAQVRLVLLQFGLLETVESYISNSDNDALKIEWANRLTFERSNPLLNTAAQELNLTSEQLDTMFDIGLTL